MKAWSREHSDADRHRGASRVDRTGQVNEADDRRDEPRALRCCMWCRGVSAGSLVLFPHIVPGRLLGANGHPQRGDFLPAIDLLPLRMFAGASIDFGAPLTVGMPATLTQRIVDLQHKQGASGDLIFVSPTRDRPGRHDARQRAPEAGLSNRFAGYRRGFFAEVRFRIRQRDGASRRVAPEEGSLRATEHFQAFEIVEQQAAALYGRAYMPST